MDGSTHPINTNDGRFTDAVVDEREGGYVPPDIVITPSKGPPVVSQGTEMESAADAASSIDNVAVTLDLYAALTNTSNTPNTNNTNTNNTPVTDISSV